MAHQTQNATLDPLRELEELFELAPAGQAKVDPTTERFIRVNRKLCDITGYTRQEFENLSCVRIAHPDDQPTIRSLFEKMVRGEICVYTHRERYIRKDGEAIWVEVMAACVGQGAGAYVVKNIRDITEQVRAEEALEKAAAELKRTNRDLAQLVYVFGHDMQEPLRMVTGHLAVVQQNLQGSLEPSVQECMDFAMDGAKRMDQMIQDLLRYARTGTRLNLQLVDLNEAVAEVMVNLQKAASDAGARITPHELPVVRADPMLVISLLQNLIGNAIKYRSPQRPLTVDLWSHRMGEFWQISVADNGIGIEPRYQERIFDMFYRLHTRHETFGTGMGLAICRKIVESHGGTICMESVPDRGAVFHFTLPAAPPEP